MAKHVYLNRRTGRSREFIGCAIVLGLIIVLALLAFLFFAGTWGLFDDWKKKDKLAEFDCDGGRFPMGGDSQDQKGTVYTISASKARLLWREVRNSPYIKVNAMYDAVAENIVFRYEPFDNNVNAYATISHEESAQSSTLVVCLLGGAVRYARLIAMATVVDPEGKNHVLAKMIEGLPDNAYSQLSEDAAKLIAKSNGFDQVSLGFGQMRRLERISTGTLLSILSHEAGHHVLGHCHGRPRGNFEISRNREREADSFASSVISASPYHGEDMLVGELLWDRALAIQEKLELGAKDARKEELRRTHPYSIERYENFIRANSEKAQELGLTVK